MEDPSSHNPPHQQWSEPPEPSVDRASTSAEVSLPVHSAPPNHENGGVATTPGDSPKAGPFEQQKSTDGRASASPRRTSEDLQRLCNQTREEVHRHAQALQASLATLFNQIEAVKEEHDKLYNHNKFLQQYIGDLMSTSKITASSSSRAKK
ncbi:hypothetical protein VTJ83DRAFT_751 [Remersonia thermophila]|uniref:BZIP transcription factor n=1 Tax=Remersonia thermophila TaxID=72144 RepID=A0ABR4DMQ1_9PEZI